MAVADGLLSRIGEALGLGPFMPREEPFSDDWFTEEPTVANADRAELERRKSERAWMPR